MVLTFPSLLAGITTFLGKKKILAIVIIIIGHNISKLEDEACNDLGYERFEIKMGFKLCVSSSDISFVDVECDGILNPTKCTIKEISVREGMRVKN